MSGRARAHLCGRGHQGQHQDRGAGQEGRARQRRRSGRGDRGRQDRRPACLTDDSLQVNGSLIKGITVQALRGRRRVPLLRGRLADHGGGGDRTTSSTRSSRRTRSTGRVDHSFASGANDTGFYVGQSHDARMDHNVATDNVSGYEIENSTRVTRRPQRGDRQHRRHPVVHAALPRREAELGQRDRPQQRPRQQQAQHMPRSRRRRLRRAAGRASCCSRPTRTRSRHNTSTGNDSYRHRGRRTSASAPTRRPRSARCSTSSRTPTATGSPPTTVTGNGSNPDPDLPAVFAVDLAWDTTGVGNCWANNVFGTSFPDPLPACP